MSQLGLSRRLNLGREGKKASDQLACRSPLVRVKQLIECRKVCLQHLEMGFIHLLTELRGRDTGIQKRMSTDTSSKGVRTARVQNMGILAFAIPLTSRNSLCSSSSVVKKNLSTCGAGSGKSQAPRRSICMFHMIIS